MINKTLRDKIIPQVKREIDFARQYKQSRIKSWKKNEDMYYGRKFKSEDSRANVELGKMQGFVHTILSKIDNPLVFKYIKRKEADLKKAARLNALRERDSSSDDWDFKDILGKKQAIIYGRAIYCYYADSARGYKSHLENVDVYDFLIDPAAGGYDLENAFYLGRYGIVKTTSQLKQGAKDGLYIKEMVTEMTRNQGGNADEITQEDIDKSNRYFNFSKTNQRQLTDTDKYKFWEWYTTYEGERYYLLITDSGQCIRCELLSDVFASNLYPFWSWSAFPDLTEFWSPSYCDYVREVFMAQSVSINQMLDNAEQINKPMKAVITKYVENMSELKFRKDGYIRLKETDDINKALMVVNTPSIQTPITVYQTLESIGQLESGVTSAAKGVAEEDKVGIYEGNQAATADRFGLLNKSYAYGYKRFAVLYEQGVYENLTKKIAVEILGPNGVEVEQITRRDIKPYGGFNYLVQASDAEQNADAIDKRNRATFLNNNALNPLVNQKKRLEMEATIIGFNMDEIKELLDIEQWGNAELMSEAARDIERLINGELVKPNEAANIAYKQKIVDWMRDHREDVSDEVFFSIVAYVQALEPFVMRNMVRSLTDLTSKIGLPMPGTAGTDAAPDTDVLTGGSKPNQINNNNKPLANGY